MARLSNPRLEHVAQLLFAGKSAADASRGAGYPDDGSAFIDNARRRANRRDVKARVAEMQENAARAAEIDKTFILLELRDRLEFNLDDYLTPATVDVWGRPVPRKLNLDSVPRHLLRRIKKYTEGKRGGIEGADPVAVLAQLAKTAGIDRDQTAEAVTGIGQRLAAAIKRLNLAKTADDGAPAAIPIKRDR
jgi:hypothetical protein